MAPAVGPGWKQRRPALSVAMRHDTSDFRHDMNRLKTFSNIFGHQNKLSIFEYIRMLVMLVSCCIMLYLIVSVLPYCIRICDFRHAIVIECLFMVHTTCFSSVHIVWHRLCTDWSDCMRCKMFKVEQCGTWFWIWLWTWLKQIHSSLPVSASFSQFFQPVSAEVGWEEFEAAAKRLNFQGDLPGAWRFFDQERRARRVYRVCKRDISWHIVTSTEMEMFGSWSDLVPTYILV